MGVSMDLVTAKKQFKTQRGSAKYRGIIWDLSFEQWTQIWIDSGKYHLRGCKRGLYVMSRLGDTGPYSVDNVEIKTHADNLSEAHLGVPKPPFSLEHRRKIGVAAKRNATLRNT